MRRIQLIWDFRGPSAAKTAAHHAIHLEEYAKAHSLSKQLVGTQTVNETHHFAFLVVDEAEMRTVRDALKPHRGLVYTEN